MMAEQLRLVPKPSGSEGGVLSAEGGSLEASPRLRRFLAILSDGKVLAVPAALRDPEFRTLQHRAQASGIRLQAPTEASLDEVAAANANVRDVREFATQARQALLSILARAAQFRASDVLISRQEGHALLRYRIDGTMRTDRTLDPDRAAAMSNAAFNLCDSGDSLASTTRAVRAAITDSRVLPTDVTGARLQYAPTATGFALLVRLSYSHAALRCQTLEEAGFSAPHATALRAAVQSAAGVILVAGPTEHGKSTTLNLAIDEFARGFVHAPNIVAVEDPPESRSLPHVQAFSVNTSVETEAAAFESALLASLRMAPDGMKIGEIRDRVSAHAAYTAAGSGTLVFATLHAAFATDIPFRLMDLGLEPYRAFDTLNLAWVSQRLVPEVCPDCAIPFRNPASDAHRSLVRDFGHRTSELTDARLTGPGCDACGASGSLRRSLFLEIVRPHPELLAFGLSGTASRQAFRRAWLDRGGESVVASAYDRVRNGQVSLDAFCRTVAGAATLDADLNPGGRTQ